MDQHDTIDQLNRLFHVNKDAEAGLQAAAADVHNSELETLLGGYAKQHANLLKCLTRTSPASAAAVKPTLWSKSSTSKLSASALVSPG